MTGTPVSAVVGSNPSASSVLVIKIVGRDDSTIVPLLYGNGKRLSAYLALIRRRHRHEPQSFAS